MTRPIVRLLCSLLLLAPLCTAAGPAPRSGAETEAAPRKEPSAAAVAAWEKDYLPGTAVVHRSFGPGVVESRAGSLAVIDFGEAGVRKVELTACLRRRLIRLASSPGF